MGAFPNQRAGGRGDARMAALAPQPDAAADVMDVVVLARLLPVGEGALFGLLAGPRDGDEVAAGRALLDDLVGDAVVGELEVPPRPLEGRVGDRALDDDLAHGWEVREGPGLTHPFYSRRCAVEITRGSRSRRLRAPAKSVRPARPPPSPPRRGWGPLPSAPAPPGPGGQPRTPPR